MRGRRVRARAPRARAGRAGDVPLRGDVREHVAALTRFACAGAPARCTRAGGRGARHNRPLRAVRAGAHVAGRAAQRVGGRGAALLRAPAGTQRAVMLNGPWAIYPGRLSSRGRGRSSPRPVNHASRMLCARTRDAVAPARPLRAGRRSIARAVTGRSDSMRAPYATSATSPASSAASTAASAR